MKMLMKYHFSQHQMLSKRDCALRGKSRRKLSSSINIHCVNSYTSSRFFISVGAKGPRCVIVQEKETFDVPLGK